MMETYNSLLDARKSKRPVEGPFQVCHRSIFESTDEAIPEDNILCVKLMHAGMLMMIKEGPSTSHLPHV